MAYYNRNSARYKRALVEACRYLACWELLYLDEEENLNALPMDDLEALADLLGVDRNALAKQYNYKPRPGARLRPVNYTLWLAEQRRLRQS